MEIATWITNLLRTTLTTNQITSHRTYLSNRATLVIMKMIVTQTTEASKTQNIRSLIKWRTIIIKTIKGTTFTRTMIFSKNESGRSTTTKNTIWFISSMLRFLSWVDRWWLSFKQVLLKGRRKRCWMWSLLIQPKEKLACNSTWTSKHHSSDKQMVNTTVALMTKCLLQKELFKFIQTVMWNWIYNCRFGTLTTELWKILTIEKDQCNNSRC